MSVLSFDQKEVHRAQLFSLYLVIFFITLFPFSSAFASLINNVIPLTLIEKSFIYVSCILLIATGKSDELVSRTLIALYLGVIVITLQMLIYHNNLPLSLNAYVRLTFPFLLFALLSFHVRRFKLKTICAIKFCVFTLIGTTLCSILLGYSSGLGGEVLGRGVQLAGNKGFFIGANEVGLLLLLLLIVVNRVSSFTLRYMLLAAVMVCGGIVLTKSSLVASLCSALLMCYRFKLLRLLAFLLCMALVTYNFEVILILVADLTSGTFLDVGNQQFWQFLLRGRQNYIEAFFLNTNMDSITTLMRVVFIGMGENYVADTIATGIAIEQGRRSTFEADFLDLFFSMGGIYFMCYLTAIFCFLKSFFRYLCFEEKVFVGLIVVHAFIAGHVIYSPMITSTFVLLFFFIKYYSRTKTF